MRRWLFVLGVCTAFGCGLNAVASKTFEGPPDAGEPEAGIISLPKNDGSADGSGDAGPDGPVDAEADRPDAGVVFAPSHIQPVYTLTAGDVSISQASTIDTTNRTIALNGAAAVVSPDIVHSDGVAVWSVGSLTTDQRLTVVGDRPLVIVAARDVTIRFTVSAFGELAVPGPGGSLPALGAGKGTNGAKTGSDASGGGGAGHGTAGGVGGDKSGVKGGLAGVTVNANAATLIGGAGGGNGGGFALGTCGNSGRGGVGGGAIQISAVGRIIVTTTGGIDVGGGGGSGGCKNNGGSSYSGGGGGGAGGLVVLESVGGVQLDFGSTLGAPGGGGGEGGDSNSNGAPGGAGLYPSGLAFGGSGGFGGNGGNGGVGGPFASAPGAGVAGGDTGGGGGGATGRVFLRTRGAAALLVSGTVAAQRTDDPTF